MENVLLHIPDHVVSREVGDETVVLNLESGNYFGLNEVGARIWSGLAAGVTPAEIRASIVTEFAVDQDVIAKDMEELVGKLLTSGLLER